MSPDLARLLRLRRLEKIREIARQGAARDAATAENTLAQLRSLSERTGHLAAEYGLRRDAADGAALRHLAGFVGGLDALRRNARDDAMRAQAIADAKLRLLAEAERRRAAAGERADVQERIVARVGETPALGARKPTGTSLE